LPWIRHCRYTHAIKSTHCIISAGDIFNTENASWQWNLLSTYQSPLTLYQGRLLVWNLVFKPASELIHFNVLVGLLSSFHFVGGYSEHFFGVFPCSMLVPINVGVSLLLLKGYCWEAPSLQTMSSASDDSTRSIDQQSGCVAVRQ
jgi:hypothetical protein